LLGPDLEGALARDASAQIPFLKSTHIEARVETPKSVHAMEVDFEAAAKLWDKVAAFLVSEFGG
jgi:iron(III) transport system substrate-binding protein